MKNAKDRQTWSSRNLRAKFLNAAERMDWQQVILNAAPPCFHLEEDGRFCGRAQRWAGHLDLHDFVSLVDLLISVPNDSIQAPKPNQNKYALQKRKRS